ncbi:MAG: PAS domain-containing sensor histidine kinase [Planctomycetota bacterium]|nr:PAS domain-containing sensor histidine kinase [Planctomycetota bacterium]
MSVSNELLIGVGGAALGWFLASLKRGLSVKELGPVKGETAPMVRAFEHLNEGVLVLDEEETVRAMNTAAQRLLAWPSSKSLPAQLEEVAGTEITAAVRTTGEGVALMPIKVNRKGEDFTFKVILGPAGRARRFVVLEDLSAIAKVDRRRRDFVANSSHELQTPLAALIGMLDLLEDASGEYADNLVRRCQKKAVALSLLTRDLIGLAKAQDDAWVPSATIINVKELCLSVIDNRAEGAVEKGLHVSVSVPTGLEVIGDPVALETCLANLVQNAIWYTDAGSLTLRATSHDDGGVVLEVEDTGSGIAPEHLSRIFERFFRADPARSRASGGTGLGLAIVKNLIGRMGGRVAVSSRLGEGSCFQLELPADPAHPLEGAGQALQEF